LLLGRYGTLVSSVGFETPSIGADHQLFNLEGDSSSEVRITETHVSDFISVTTASPVAAKNNTKRPDWATGDQMSTFYRNPSQTLRTRLSVGFHVYARTADLCRR
jgi:hypothetical protein